MYRYPNSPMWVKFTDFRPQCRYICILGSLGVVGLGSYWVLVELDFAERTQSKVVLNSKYAY